MGRRIWVKDVIKFTEGVYLLPRNYKEMEAKGEKFQVVWSLDPEADRLVEKYFGGYQNTVSAGYGIVMGDAGCSWVEPFTTPEEALEWINKNKDRIYFGKWTHPELRKMFPEIPVQLHPAEVEKAFGIEENSPF